MIMTTAAMSTLITTAPLHYGSSHTHQSGGGDGIIDWLLRGFGMAAGRDAANQLFHAAPWLMTGLVVTALVVGLFRRRSRRSRRR